MPYEPYATPAEAEQYNATRGRSDWASLENGAKEAALLLATDAINAGRYIGGQPKGQRNRFPRTMNNSALPEEVIDACCEEAYTRACDKGMREAQKRAVEGLSSVSIGDVSRSYQKPRSAGYGAGALLWSRAAYDLLAKWRVGSAVIG